jgi:predicted N-acetyltransferase YhbS
MRRAIRAAKEAGHSAVLLVGDAPYYGRFGFSAKKTGALAMSGADQPDRLLGLELSAGALDDAHGVIRADARRRRPAARAAQTVAVAQAA